MQILGGVAEGALSLPACAGVLLDALTVVASKAIRAGAKGRPDAEDDAPDEAAGGAAAAAAAAKGRLVSAVMKKNLMENVVPILIELKRCGSRPALPPSTAGYAALLAASDPSQEAVRRHAMLAVLSCRYRADSLPYGLDPFEVHQILTI